MTKLFPFVLSSLALHFGVFCVVGALYSSTQRIAGLSEGDPDSVFVTVVAESDATPVATTPAAFDSEAATEAHSRREMERQDSRPPFLAEETQTPSQNLLSEEEKEAPEPEKPTSQVHLEAPRREKESRASDPHTASDAYRRRSAVGSDLRDFYAVMLAAIRQSTFYPAEALKEKQHGEVVVEFTLTTEGALQAVHIVRPSLSPHLNKAAKEIIHKAAEAFPRPPSWMNSEDLHFKVPILFKEKRMKETARSSSQK